MKNSLQPYYYAAYSGMGWQEKNSRNDVDDSSGHTMGIACVRQGWKFDDASISDQINRAESTYIWTAPNGSADGYHFGNFSGNSEWT